MSLHPLITFVALAGLTAPLAACNDAKGGAPPAPALRTVLVTPIHFASDARARSFAVTIKPRIETDLGFRVAGKVAARLVDVGQQVRKGQALARLDDTDLHLQKEQAEAELAAARISAQQASDDEARGKSLRREGWTSQAAFDRQHTATAEAQGRQRRAERALELANNALAYATLTADADGAVTATAIDPGQVVTAGQAAIRIARRGEKEAVAALPEAFALRAAQGAATLTLWGDGAHAYTAQLRELAPMADPATRTFQARYALPNADDAVALGMSATLTVADPGAASTGRVPLQALFDQGKGASLWVVGADDMLVLKPVTVARYEGRDAIITGGVAEGDRVVVLGVQKLEAGQKVRAAANAGF